MYLGFWRPVALKPAPLLGVGRKCALELSNSGFGMPVAEIEVWVDDGSGELGHGYTSHIRGRTLAEVAKAAKLNKGRSFPNRKTPMGGLMADQPFGPESVQLTCTIDGSYAAHENEYREP